MEALLESDSETQGRRGGAEEEEQQEQTLDGVSAPEQLLQDWDLCPESYRMNSPDELRLLAFADNFRRQYSYIYPDRKPLLLCPVNEFGVKKFLCTALQPTPPSLPELFTWEGCASFVADFLSLRQLASPLELPRYLFSSTCVLHTQRATCLEFATLLCSLLLGANYDAYCVSGYALREMCLLDQSLQDCPLLGAQVQSETSEQQQQQENKYTVTPVKELNSHFLLQQEKKKQEAEAELLKQQLQEDTRRRPDDPLYGLRVHCWVLVLAGSRSVQENFFIDPLTGRSYSTSDDKFLGVESVWNNRNYYVTLQDCSKACADVVFDLDDLTIWEPVLFGATSKKQLILDVVKKKEKTVTRKMDIEDEEEDEEPCVFEMPRSWVSYINISKKDLETRWPGGQKVTHYRKAKLEKFAPYLRPDGLVARLTAYRDLDCTEVSTVKHWYQNRNDHLEQRDVGLVDGFTTELFKHGRCFNLLVHRYKSQASEFEHEMEFNGAHLDNLVRRVVSSGEMTEFFEGRCDFLYYRHVVFDRDVPFSRRLSDAEGQCVQKVVERFHRDASKPGSADVAERVFLRSHRRIELTYHLEDYRFIPSKRSFNKPQPSSNNKDDFTPALVSSFQVDSSAKPLDTHTLHNMLQALLRAEEKTLLQIHRSSKEVRDITACREQEERHIQLLFSPWTPTGAATVRSLREEIERQADENHRWLRDDSLAPFLMRLNNTETLSAKDARQVHKDCLAEYKQKLADEANLIQERYEKETLELQEKQAWYHKNQPHMTKEQEAEYQSFCAEKTLQIHVAKKRLSLHKEAAPQKLKAFDQKLKQDPRLAPHLLR